MWVRCLQARFPQMVHMQEFTYGNRRNFYLELSSNKKELLTALFESSVISTLMLEMTCAGSTKKLLGSIFGREEYRIIQALLVNRIFPKGTYIWRYTSSIIVVIPVQRAYSIQLLDTQNLMKKPRVDEKERELPT